MQKLPVIAVIKEALETVWQKRRRLALAIAGIILLMSILDIASKELIDEATTIWSELAITFIGLLAFTLFAVTCHRVILLEEDAVPSYGIFSWSARETRFFGWSTIGALVFLAVFILLRLALPLSSIWLSSVEAISWLGYAIILLPGAYLFSRLSILLPATALDNRHGIAWAWRITEHNGWRMTLMAAVIPGMIVQAQDYLVTSNLVLDFLFSIGIYAISVLEIALLSESYRYLCNTPVEPQPEGA
jgi:hypothetical protein